MFKAIQTKFIGPTNTRGSRYKASDCDGNSITLHSDHALNPEANHLRAAVALCEKMQWDGALRGGCLGDSYVWVFDSVSANSCFVVRIAKTAAST